MPDVPLPRAVAERKARRASLTVLLSACSVPLLIVGQFAMLAIVPVALVLVGTLRHAHLRALRWWAAALAAAYALPLVLWAIGPDRAPSLSKDMHPVLAAVVVLAAVAVIIAFSLVRGRRTGTPAAVPDTASRT